MPNWVRCYINFGGNDSDMNKVFNAIKSLDKDGNENVFDFNKLIPMPDSLNIEAGSMSDLAYAYYMVKVRSTLPNNVSYSSKKDVIDRVEKDISISSHDMLERGKVICHNYEKYGSKDWYDWCCSNWGTKWNACQCERSEDSIDFETAWSWPEPVMLKLAELCSKYGIRFEGKWADEDCGSNTGYFYFDGGADSVLDYDYYELGSSDAYEAYVDCWGESECIGIDNDGNYYHYECGESCPNNCQ